MKLIKNRILLLDLWDYKADCITNGDCLRDIKPILDKTYQDKNDFTHYIFSKMMFYNPKYTIPDDDYELFVKFLDGGSREYPSDGNLPVDIAAIEAKKVLDKIAQIAMKSNHKYCKNAREELRKRGEFGLIRGTIKLYLGNYTTRDWRRKRFTDDIDFWIFDKKLLEYALKKSGWIRNKRTREFEKMISWFDFRKQEMQKTLITASNDIDQILDFGLGSYLDGPNLKDIFKKKLQRGHNVDLSDIINVAIVNNRDENYLNKDWTEAWIAIEESANTRNTRITSNLISLCRFSYGIADYLERVSKAIGKHQGTVLEMSKYSDKKIVHVCKLSSHHSNYSLFLKPSITRNRIFNNLTKQKIRKLQYARNLRNFATNLLKILNSKYKTAKTIFEIENAGN